MDHSKSQHSESPPPDVNLTDNSTFYGWLFRLIFCILTSTAIAGCGGGEGEGARDPLEVDVANSDAGVSIRKTVQSLPQDESDWRFCANENERCNFAGTTTVRYGINSSTVEKQFSDGVQCNNANFGDPLSGAIKVCWIKSGSAAVTWTTCANENGKCEFTGLREVRYGTATKYVTKTLVGPVYCNNGVFGDPAYGSAKSCSLAADVLTICANENGVCELASLAVVRYGTVTSYTEKSVSGRTGCNNITFGDPAPGVFKTCWIVPISQQAAAVALPTAVAVIEVLSPRDAFRLADQATFGATEPLVKEIQEKGATAWVAAQMALSSSRYTLGNGDAIHKNQSAVGFCDQPSHLSTNCWRDWYSPTPLVWNFYRNATQQSDQLRQRVAFALQQMLVVNNPQVEGTYAFRLYYNNLLDNALGNYREILKKVALSPVMGEFLNNVNNDKASPNENFGRELLQLFSIGTCNLNSDGSLQGGKCTATYSNDVVRSYAYALTGWTYPAGGATSTGICFYEGRNCKYFGGDMTPTERLHDTNERLLLSGVTVPAGSTAPQALELVLNSLMQHPNMAAFIGRQLIQHLVTSNPSAAYVQRVATTFVGGRFVSGSNIFGTGQRGDLAATVAAILLDAEARADTPTRTSGKLREPVLMFTALLRGLNGRTDGDALGWRWGESLRQHVFYPPSVFNFYPPDYPVPGSKLTGPAFALHNASTALERLNFLTYLLYQGGTAAASDIPGAVGTTVDTASFETDAADAPKLVDRLSVLATGSVLQTTTRTSVISAVNAFTSQNNNSWKSERVKQAAYLIYATPNFQVER